MLEIHVPETYPFNPPKVKFLTKIWHPNISSVTGAICLDILKDNWAAAMTLRTVLLSLQALLASAEPDDPQDAVVATQYKENHEMFCKTAKHWTNCYAKGDKKKEIFSEKDYSDSVSCRSTQVSRLRCQDSASQRHGYQRVWSQSRAFSTQLGLESSHRAALQLVSTTPKSNWLLLQMLFDCSSAPESESLWVLSRFFYGSNQPFVQPWFVYSPGLSFIFSLFLLFSLSFKKKKKNIFMVQSISEIYKIFFFTDK